VTARCCHCRRPFEIGEITYLVPQDDGTGDEWCEDCDADLPPQLRPSLGFVPALLRSVRGDAAHTAGIAKVLPDERGAYIWQQVPWRTDGQQRRRADGPRVSRFGDIE
jgi:hypothetical protein